MKFIKKYGSILVALSLFLGLCLPLSAESRTEQVTRKTCLAAAEASLPYSLAFSENGQTVYNRIVTCLTKGEESASFEDCMISADELHQIVTQISHTHQEFFYFSGVYTYYYFEENGQTFGFEPQYYTYDQPLAEVKKIFNRETSHILSQVGSSWSEVEKALFLHDYLAANYAYDSNSEIFDLYNFLTKKKGVCQAYTDLYQYLLNKVGVEASAVASDSMNHTWNVVKIGEKWYHVDITWDDPLSQDQQDYYGVARHDFFLLSDQAIREREHSDWYWITEEQVCDDPSFEQAYWKDSIAPVAVCGGKWYYIGNNGIYCTENPAAVLLPFDQKWSVAGAPAYFSIAFSGLASFDGRLFYNTPSEIRFFDPVSGKTETLYTLPEEGSQIFGLTMSDGIIQYVAESTPGKISEIKTLKVNLPDMLGDINGDLAVNTKDAVSFGRMLAGWSGISCSLKTGDIDGDQAVNVKDCVLLKRWLAKWNIPYRIGAFVF